MGKSQLPVNLADDEKQWLSDRVKEDGYGSMTQIIRILIRREMKKDPTNKSKVGVA